MSSRLFLIVLLGCTLAQAPARADDAAAPAAVAASPNTMPGAPMDICGTHEKVVKVAREASKLLGLQKDAPYFAVKQRLMLLNDHYAALHEALTPLMPPSNDLAAEALWRADAIGELLQESGENLNRLGREMKTAMRVCGHDVAAYEAEFGAACEEGAEIGCAEKVYAKYCAKAHKRNRLLVIDQETELAFLKWPRFFDNHWAGPTKVGEAGEGWREEWTYGSEDEVWQNLGAQTAQDENRLENLAWTEETYSAYTMVDAKPLVSRMVYNVVHGTMDNGKERSLDAAIDFVAARIKQVMRCDAMLLADAPGGSGPAPVNGEAATPVRATQPPTAGAE